MLISCSKFDHWCKQSMHSVFTLQIHNIIIKTCSPDTFLASLMAGDLGTSFLGKPIYAFRKCMTCFESSRCPSIFQRCISSSVQQRNPPEIINPFTANTGECFWLLGRPRFQMAIERTWFTASFRGISQLSSAFHDFAMIQICTFLFSSNKSPQRRRSRINQQFFIGNQLRNSMYSQCWNLQAMLPGRAWFSWCEALC